MKKILVFICAMFIISLCTAQLTTNMSGTIMYNGGSGPQIPVYFESKYSPNIVIYGQGSYRVTWYDEIGAIRHYTMVSSNQPFYPDTRHFSVGGPLDSYPGSVSMYRIILFN